MGRTRTIAAAAALLFAGALALRMCRPPAPPPTPPRPEVEIPVLPAPPPAVRVPRPLPPPPPATPDPERLRAFLTDLGRARLLRDRRTLDRLRAAVPPVFDSDFPWIYGWLSGDLFLGAGAAELSRLFGRQDSVPPLAGALRAASHPFLKDILIETLGAIGGDAAEAALISGLRDDGDDSIRLRCAAALAGFHAPETMRSLILALGDPSPRVRTAAAAALARLNPTGAVDALLRALRDERDAGVQADLVMSAYAGAPESVRDLIRQSVLGLPAAGEILRTRVRIQDESRYRRPYERTFFEPGGPAIPRGPTGKRIGITLETGAAITPREVGSMLFSVAPLDRYRDWFYVRKASDFPATAAFDASGNALPDVPYDDLEGTVFLHFKDPATFAEGVLGFTQGCHAFVQGVSLLHEFGHAFGTLGDEYADGSRFDASNVSRKAAAPWRPLIQFGVLAAPIRRDADFYIPSDNCFLNNSPLQSRYCPVCQLQVHSRMAELAGAPLQW